MRVPIAEHTRNRWVAGPDGTQTISNAVYKLVCRYHQIAPEYAGGRGAHVVEWKLTTNAAVRRMPIFTVPVYENAYIVNKRSGFYSEEKALECVERIKAEFEPYFRELYPPIPKEYQYYFLVGDKLLHPFRTNPNEE